jgi:hypothetical protein
VYNKLRQEYQMMDLFDFRATREIGQAQINTLVPKWYRS